MPGGNKSSSSGPNSNFEKMTHQDLANLTPIDQYMGKDPFAFSSLSYPLDLTNPGGGANGHYMVFYINIRNKTKYIYNTPSGGYASSGGFQAGTADGGKFMNKKVEKSENKSDIKKAEIIKKESSFKKKKKVKKNITSGIAYVYSTFNNTIISIADENGNVVSWSSAGAKGFKGSRKSTPYAAQVAADDAGAKAYEQGLRTLTVQVKGPGSGRETALRSLQSRGFKILSIKDTTPMAHNGARPPKRRRV